MESKRSTEQDLKKENEQLRKELEEANETLRAIQNGEVQAVVASAEEGEQVLTLGDADKIYRTIVEDMSDGTATLTKEGTILYCNNRLANMLGASLEEVIGTPLFRFIAPPDQSTLEALLGQAIKRRGASELRLITRQGESVPAYVSVNSLQLEEEERVCMVAVDLTQQKRFQQIVAQERLSQAMIEQATESIIVCDKDGQIVRCSEQAKEICPTNPLMQYFDSVFSLQLGRADSQTSETGLFSIRDCLRGKEFKKTSCSCNGKGDEELSLILNAGPILGEGNEIVGCTVTLTDVTALERKVQELESFAYTISHDLRGPLHTVRSFADALGVDLENEQKDRVMEDVQAILAGVQRMDRLLTCILQYSRAGKVAQPTTTVAFGDIVKEALQQVRDQLTSVGASVSVSQHFPVVYADSMRMVEALSNLVQNSIDYRDKSRYLTIEIGHYLSDDEVVFFVRDNGTGIRADKLEKIFELFYRGDRGSQGIGAGVPIVKKIINGHGGRLWVDSEEGKGTTISFTLQPASGGGGWADSD